MGNVRLARTITFPGKGDYINPRTIPSRSCVGTAAEDRARKRAVACGYTLEAAIKAKSLLITWLVDRKHFHPPTSSKGFGIFIIGFVVIHLQNWAETPPFLEDLQQFWETLPKHGFTWLEK